MRYLAVIGVVFCGLGGWVLGEVRKPNVMVFLVDDMGVMDSSVAFLTDEEGKAKRYPLNEFYRTPAMARLAEKGVRFNQFYAMSVCSPSRISILTGQNAARHGATNWIDPKGNNAGEFGPPKWNWEGLKEGAVTLPRELAKVGYRTIHVGKAHLGAAGYEGADPLKVGFEENVGGAAFGMPGSYYGEKAYGKGTRRRAHAVPHLEEYHGTETFLTEALTLEAKKRVAQAVKDKKPFFLHFAHYAVHSPFESDPRFAENYKDSDRPKKARAFATLIEGMDRSLGEMLDCFEELGIAENTLVIFLGDNGSDGPLGHQHEVACAAPLRGKKGAHYEGGIRVPMIAAWAKRNDEVEAQKALGIPAGVIQEQVASVEDLFPTLLKVTGAKLPEGHVVDGSLLHTLLTGKKDGSRKEQFLMHYPHGIHRSNYFTTWRDGDWKVIYHTMPELETKGGLLQSGGGRYELFNLAKDPFEQRNMATVKSRLLKKMMAEMQKRLGDYGALYPVNKAGEELKPELPGHESSEEE